MSKAKNDHLEEENKEAEVASEEIKEETEETTEAKPEEAEEKPKAKKSSKKTDNSKKSTKKQEEPKEEETEKKPSAEQQVKEANDKYLRLMAEYDNYRKRSQKEREALYGDIKADVLNKFLPVYDNLVRALDQPTEDEAYRKGVEMIMAQFNKTMENLGVTEIESVGQPFDPNLHNAVMHVEDETKGENEIVEVFQKGFKLGDKVIRFAMVKVAN
ncbi:MAG: nucleotide exchange factor GrpE [Oscillospiraceae bacterium]|nr:nucleotide exchange factor GrpE [Oscillospiraceae bacterium]